MEQTLVILKPAAVHRHIMGEVISRFEKKGLYITGMKMMQLDETILREHYAHLVDRPFLSMDTGINDGGSGSRDVCGRQGCRWRWCD